MTSNVTESIQADILRSWLYDDVAIEVALIGCKQTNKRTGSISILSAYSADGIVECIVDLLCPLQSVSWQ